MTADAHGNFRGKHLVVFGCGYVGGEVVRQALQGGLRVTALTRNEAKAIILQQLGAEVVVDDLARTNWHEKIKGSGEFVLNCVSSGGGGIDGYRRSYLAGMESIVDWSARRGGVGTVVYTSSTSVYPQSGGAIADIYALHR